MSKIRIYDATNSIGLPSTTNSQFWTLQRPVGDITMHLDLLALNEIQYAAT